MKCSKRKLALALTLLILVIAGIAWSVQRARLARRQADFLASVVSSGGSVVMDYEVDGRPAPGVPLWLRGAWGDCPYAHVVKVKVSNVDELKTVGEFAELRELDCSSCMGNLADELKFLQRCKHLRVVNLQGESPNSNWAVEHLADFPELQAVDLSEASKDPTLLACFKHTPQLRTLRLGKTDIGDKGLRRLRFLKGIEELDLRETGIQGPGLTALQGMRQLRKLDLHGNAIDGRHLANLKDLALLEELDLGETRVDDASMAVLAGLKRLKRLDLTGTAVRGPGLRRLHGLKQLSVRMTLDSTDLEDIDGSIPILALQIRCGAFTDNGLYHLTLYPMLEELDLSGSNLDDAGLKHLAGLTQLKKLDLANTLITDAGLRQLGGLTQLQELSLAFDAIQGPGLEVLKNMPRLETLSLSVLPLRDYDLKLLEGLPHLRELAINGDFLTDAALDRIAGLKQLRKINLGRADIAPQRKQKLRAALPALKIEGE